MGKRLYVSAVLALALAVVTWDNIHAQTGTEKMSAKERLSYTMGYETGKRLLGRFPGSDPDIVARGIMDVLAGAGPVMTDGEMRSIRSESRLKTAREEAEKNRRDGEAFLSGNKLKDGVVTLASGLQYKVIREGKGRVPVGYDKVRVNYRGTFIDGREFANTYREGDEGPWIVYVNDVIPGWSEALKLMKAGSKWTLFIPPDLAYGERGNPPNSVLIYELELLSIH